MRTEAIPIHTRSMSDVQMLTNQGGTPTTIAGVLRLPRPHRQQPAVILLHGSGGCLDYLDDWAGLLNGAGIATFLLDSFSGRGLENVEEDQGTLGRLSGIADAYAALERLSRHERIDPGRIALMGFSRGGQSALYAGMQRFAGRNPERGVSFAGIVSFYPNCCFRYLEDTRLIDAPIRIFHGEADDFNPCAATRAFVARAQEAGADIRLTTYPGAHHGFDSRTLPPLARLPRAQSTRNCILVERAPGELINQASGLPFRYDDPCIERGTHIGYHEGAARDAREQVSAFLRDLFEM